MAISPKKRKIDATGASVGRLARQEVRVGGLFIEILGRQMTCDALVVTVGATPLIGQIPLEGCDLVVDPRSGEARPNPAHPDMPIFDLMAVA